jgi:hypothetical protein
MKIYGFTKKSLTNYEDNQITIPVAESRCSNIPLLVEHATMNTFYTLEDFAQIYWALGHEYGIGHLNSTETILMLNHFDIKLADRFQALRKPEDLSDVCQVFYDEWHKTRHEYKRAEIDARSKLISRRYAPIPPCTAIKPVEIPGTFSSK